MENEAKAKRVLVIEDEKALLDFFAFDFSGAGYEVFAAENGEEALLLLSEQHVDAIVSDVELPNKSGLEVVDEIRKMRDPRGPAFILISGNLQLKAEQYFHLGVNAFFHKPFNRGELMQALEYYLSPLESRWKMTEQLSKKASGGLSLSLDSYLAAAKEGVFRLGQGGFFLSLSGNLPEPGDFLSFDIGFNDAPGKSCEGVGEVRWVRSRSTAEEGSGIGVEVRGLTEKSLVNFENLLTEHKPVPFIPKV
jgi:CheY-like chemotaxis protein